MTNKMIIGIPMALLTLVAAISPALAQFYVNLDDGPYGSSYGSRYGNPYGNPYYNNNSYRGYSPYDGYGYVQRRRSYSLRNAAIGAGIGAGIGAAVGLFSSRRGRGYYY